MHGGPRKFFHWRSNKRAIQPRIIITGGKISSMFLSSTFQNQKKKNPAVVALEPSLWNREQPPDLAKFLLQLLQFSSPFNYSRLFPAPIFRWLLHHRSLPLLFQVLANRDPMLGLDQGCKGGFRGARRDEHSLLPGRPGAVAQQVPRSQPIRECDPGGAESGGLHFPEALWAPCCFRVSRTLDHWSLGLLGRLRARRAGLTEQGAGHGLCRSIRGLRRGRSGRVAGQPPRGAPARRGALSSYAAAECRPQRMRRGFCHSPRDGPERASSYCLAARLPWPS